MNLIFKRREMKYKLTVAQYELLQSVMQEYMTLDQYGVHTIQNLYFDTEDYLLIRRSIEKPRYKEKLRVRAYGMANEQSTVFVELKKKFKGIVYKRRVAMTDKQAHEFLAGQLPADHPSQIIKEIDYFMHFYKNLRPRVLLSYQREAYFGKEDPNFRMTFDQKVLVRDQDIDLSKAPYGDPILPSNTVLLEVKTNLGLPRWLLDFFSEHHIFKTSFSKYGTAYQNILRHKVQGGTHHVA